MRFGAVHTHATGLDARLSRRGAQRHGLSTRQRRHADHDRMDANPGGARGLDGSGLESGCVKGSAGIASSSTRWIDGSLENVTGNCPCAKKWQMRQPSVVSRLDCAGPPGRCPFEAAPIEWDEPASSCKHGPHSVTAAWHAINEANSSCLTNRDMVFPIWVHSTRSTKTPGPSQPSRMRLRRRTARDGMIERIINAGHKYTNQYEQSDPDHQDPTPDERAGFGAGSQGMRPCANPFSRRGAAAGGKVPARSDFARATAGQRRSPAASGGLWFVQSVTVLVKITTPDKADATRTFRRAQSQRLGRQHPEAVANSALPSLSRRPDPSKALGTLTMARRLLDKGIPSLPSLHAFLSTACLDQKWQHAASRRSGASAFPRK